MIRKLMICSLLALAALPHSSARASESAQREFKGFAAIKRIVSERWVGEDKTVTLGGYLGDYNFYSFGGLTSLLGTYDNNGAMLNSTFRNGEPNVIALLLWHLVFSGLGQDLGAQCDVSRFTREVVYSVQDSLANAVRPLCAWPAETAKADDVLLNLWLALMSFDAPESEFEAWRDFFKGPAYATANGPEVIAAMVLAAYNNPHFLLRK